MTTTLGPLGASSVAENIEWVGQSQLIVAVVCGAGPEADGVDPEGLRPPFAFASDLVLVRVDAGHMPFGVDPGDMIEAVVSGIGDAKEALVEHIRAAH